MTYHDNVGDSDRWQDPRDIQDGETDQPAPTPILEIGPVFNVAVSHSGCNYLAQEDSVCDKCGRYIKPYRQLERELSSARAEVERLREAEEIVAWLELMIVEVRKPALYGSWYKFTAAPTDGDEGCEDTPSNLRELARAARVQIEKEKNANG